MYPRSKFQEIMLAIREEMARDADFDVDLFVEMVRSGTRRGSQVERYSVVDTDDDVLASESQRKRSATRSK